jgi:glyoxylase-like metal-dependent hydrolase (beta-lactamase superfamily II)
MSTSHQETGRADTDEADQPRPLVTDVASALSPLVRRILAPNPGMMTGPGTNTYLVGVDEIAVIDPGPDDPGHIEAILGCGGDRIRWVLCTHTHIDHWPAAVAVAARTGAEILAFDSRDGLEVSRGLADGDTVDATEFRLRAVHTPGHASNHLCYLLEEERLLFTGDHLMEGSTVVISPPDGDMATYLDSLRKLLTLRPPLRTLAPAHGHLLTDPAKAVNWFVDHRLDREAKVAEVLAAAGGPVTVDALVPLVYDDVDEERYKVARRSLWAHLRKLADDGRAVSSDADDLDAGTWTVAPA